ncbi:MAG: hypothetical protein HC888_01915 [Candidatus Competibacteraceae bacterium]|nr:hypothetical protein [Candidatus Competibacteraceae bacterium]
MKSIRSYIKAVESRAWVVANGPSFFELPIQPPDGVAIEDAQEIYKYVSRNAGQPQPEPLVPEAYLSMSHISYMVALVRSAMGEAQGDYWLQNTVFKNIPTEVLLGTSNVPETGQYLKDPLQQQNTPDDSTQQEYLMGQQLSSGFMSTWGNQINDFVQKLKNQDTYRMDPEKVDDGLEAALEKVFMPPQGNVQDHRITFFVENPSRLPPLGVQVLEGFGVSMKTPEQMMPKEQQNMRSVHEARKRTVNIGGQPVVQPADPQLRDFVHRILADALFDSSPGAGDGLLSAIGKFSQDPGAKDFFGYFAQHINYGAKTSQTQLKRQKGREGNLGGMVDSDGKQIELGDNEVAKMDGDAKEGQKAQQATLGEKLVRTSLGGVQDISRDLVSELRNRAVTDIQKILDSGGKPTTSQRVDYLLADALDIYIKAAMTEMGWLMNPANLQDQKKTEGKGDFAVWKDKQPGRKGIGSMMGVDARGNLTTRLSGQSLDAEMKRLIEDKKEIRRLATTGSPEYIAEQLGLPPDFVKSTLLQLKVGEAMNQDPIAALEQMDSKKIRDSFMHRWVKILAFMYGQDETGRRRFEKYPLPARKALASLIPVHSQIRQGLTGQEASSSWGWSLNRDTKESYVKMFHDFIGEPMNPEVEERGRLYRERLKHRASSKGSAAFYAFASFCQLEVRIHRLEKLGSSLLKTASFSKQAFEEGLQHLKNKRYELYCIIAKEDQ